MATVNKDFKIKSGLIVEGTTATVNGHDVLTKKQADQDYIVNLIGGTATPDNTPDTVVKRDGSGNFAAGTVTANRISIGGVGYIEDDGSIEIVNTDGDDINIIADDIRLRATDDVLITSGEQGSPSGDIALTTNGGNIRFQSADVYLGTNISYTDAERVATQGYVDQAETDAVSSANSHTDTALLDYTTTANLDTTVGGYGYIKNADLNGYALETYVDQAELDAVATANGYTDDEITSLDASLKIYADQAETDAKAYTDTRETAITTAYQNYANQAETDAVATANAYTDDAVADLVNGAPALLDTLNELAAALQDNPDVITDLQGIAAGKQDELTAGSNIDITGATISVTGLDTDDVAEGTNLYFQDYRAVDAVAANLGTGIVHSSEGAGNVFHIDETFLNTQITNGARDAISVEFGGTPLNYDSETGVIGIGIATSGGINLDGSNDLKVNRDVVDEWYDAAGAAQTAENNAIAHADALTTDDVSEGLTNQYFSDVRAKTSAAALLTGATLDNITITGDENGLTITAENGVAGSTTDDLAEGEDNLYFTESRVLDAISTQNIEPGSIDITWVRREEATWTNVATASKATCHSAGSNEGSMKYLVRVTASVGGTRHSHVTEVLATVDGSNGVAVVEYGTIYTSAEPLATVTVEWNAATSEYDLNVTTANNNSEVMVAATLMAVLD